MIRAERIVEAEEGKMGGRRGGGRTDWVWKEGKGSFYVCDETLICPSHRIAAAAFASLFHVF